MCWGNEQVDGHWISGLLKTHSLLGPRVQPVVGLGLGGIWVWLALWNDAQS